MGKGKVGKVGDFIPPVQNADSYTDKCGKYSQPLNKENEFLETWIKTSQR